ncbi:MULTISPECIES: hypothetical protein [Eikenella]|uniref:Uncharacterized protein n=1 Tax=Eikenella longinqua TaxID=1795827 RepID=A0A1A9RUD5_9NEIS|nr:MULTISPECIES: hypothetical protein [Eikenella]OAM26059.1 hypothetical protein A7P95_10110 [Eikenella longinqua]
MPRPAALLPILLLLLAIPAHAGGWLHQAQRMNREAVRKEDRQARQHKLFQGRLSQGQAQPRQVTLSAGKHYTFFADCDRHCTNIDLTLLLDGRTIAADTDPHDAPMFGWYARESGNYTLTLTMPHCSDEQCAYSIQVFEGRKPIL